MPGINSPQIPEHLKHFAKFTGFRPKHVDPSFPGYSPDRDIVNIAMWLDRLAFQLKHGDLSFWQPMADRLGLIIRDGDEVSPRLNTVFQGLVRYLEQARGLPIGDESDFKAVEDFGDYVTFEQACTELKDIDPVALQFLCSMLGFLMADALFFATRQDVLVGREGPYTFDACIGVILDAGATIRSGVDTSWRRSLESLSKAATHCVMVGIDNRAIANEVSETLVRLAKEID